MTSGPPSDPWRDCDLDGAEHGSKVTIPRVLALPEEEAMGDFMRAMAELVHADLRISILVSKG